MDTFLNCSNRAKINSVPRNMGVPKLLVESKRDLRHLFFSNCSDWAWINSVPINMGVPKLLVKSKRDLRWIIFKFAQIELRLILYQETRVFRTYWLNLSEI